MNSKTTPLERAFQIARFGTVSSISELKLTMKRENFDLRTIEGPSLLRQLNALIKARLSPESSDGAKQS